MNRCESLGGSIPAAYGLKPPQGSHPDWSTVGGESVNDAQMKHAGRMLLWEIDETAGFDTAWTSVTDGQLWAEGRASGLLPTPHWVDYRLDTSDRYATRLMAVKAVGGRIGES